MPALLIPFGQEDGLPSMPVGVHAGSATCFALPLWITTLPVMMPPLRTRSVVAGAVGGATSAALATGKPAWLMALGQDAGRLASVPVEHAGSLAAACVSCLPLLPLPTTWPLRAACAASAAPPVGAVA